MCLNELIYQFIGVKVIVFKWNEQFITTFTHIKMDRFGLPTLKLNPMWWALLQFHFEPTLYRFGLLQFIYTDLRGLYQNVEMKWNEQFITTYTQRERERERERERV